MLYSDFVKCVNHFVNISNIINDGWTLENHNNHIYLKKSVTQCVKINVNDDNKELNEFENYRFDEEDEDDQSANVASLTYRKWEYHIIHSYSYQVPVIYFNVWNSNGELLSLKQLWEAVNPNFKEYLINNKWFTLTQNEHPYLFRPFFYFHPCHTEDFLNCFNDPKCNVLITWLSSVGQIIWLKLDSAYGQMCFF